MLEKIESQEKLYRRVFSEQIKDQLIDDIINRRYRPGDKLVESALAKKFGVSQAPVREALKGLLEMGFVTIEPYKGTTVRKMTDEEIWEMLSVRASLESFAAGLCAKKITQEEIEKLEENVKSMIKAAEEGDVDKRTEYNHKFHDEIISIAGHQLIQKLSYSLRFASWSHTTGVYTTMEPLRIAKRHLEILEVLRAHDVEAAEKVMREHIMNSLESLLKGLETEEQ